MSGKDRLQAQNKLGTKSRKHARKPDARTRRTHQRLGTALLELICKKPMDDVTVREVLEHASVGRSTFYQHFSDKNDLLLSQLEMFLEVMSTRLTVTKETSDRIVPVTEMFEHVAQATRLYRALADSGCLPSFFDLAQEYFARGIERRLRELRRTSKIPARELSICAVVWAGGVLALMRWWLDRGAKESPAELDRLFHRMVWDGIR